MKDRGCEPQSSHGGSADGHRRSSSPVTTGAGTKDGSSRDAAVAAVPASEVTLSTTPSRSGLTAAGYKSAESMREAHQEWADAQIIVSSCAFCGWTYTGTVGEGRERAKAHREKKHPEACIRKPRGKGRRISKRKLRTAGEEEQIKVDAAEANRLRREREIEEMLVKVERGRERALASGGDLV